MTAHKQEPANKKIDLATKTACNLAISQNHVERIDLSPLYQADKMLNVLVRVGLPNRIAQKLLGDIFLPARNHGTMVNYVLGEKDHYSLSDLLSYVESLIKAKTPVDNIVIILKNVIQVRNSQRVRDWL